jgi:hypothetical protein
LEGWKSEVGGRITDARSPKSNAGSRMTDVRGPKTEVGSRETDDGSLKLGGKISLLEQLFTLSFKIQSLNIGHWTSVHKHRTSNIGHRTPDFGLQTSDNGLPTPGSIPQRLSSYHLIQF